MDIWLGKNILIWKNIVDFFFLMLSVSGFNNKLENFCLFYFIVFLWSKNVNIVINLENFRDYDVLFFVRYKIKSIVCLF